MVSVINNSNSVYGTVIVGFVLVVEFYLPSLPAKLKLKTKYALTVSCKSKGSNGICYMVYARYMQYRYALLFLLQLRFINSKIAYFFFKRMLGGIFV